MYNSPRRALALAVACSFVCHPVGICFCFSLPPQQRRTNIDSTPYFAPEIHVSPIYTGEDMSTSTISVDEFQALEQKVLRAVEIVKREREARAAAEAEVASLRDQLAQLGAQSSQTESQLHALSQERDDVRKRVEKMLQQMDELL
jgi:hypothetical protein